MSGWRRLARLDLTFFAWSSALTVAACGVLAWGGTHVAIMAAEPRMHSFGLSYDGRAGGALAFAEAAAVLLAWRFARSAHAVRRRIGAGVLFAWGLLLTVNALRWNGAALEPMTFALGAVLATSLVCAALVARAEPRPTRRSKIAY